MKKAMETITIIRTCKEQETQEEVALDYAVEKLSGYWTNAEDLLIQGEKLFTPYAFYQVKQ